MCADSRRAMTFISTATSIIRLCLNTSRRYRLTLLRTTAQPIFLLAVIPSRASWQSFGCHTTRNPYTDTLCCVLESRRYSDLFRKRAVLGNVATTASLYTVVNYLAAMRTERFLRPLALLRLMTRRPFLVAIRTKNPCVRLREVLLGWNVRFIFDYPCTINFSGTELLNITACQCQGQSYIWSFTIHI